MINKLGFNVREIKGIVTYFQIWFKNKDASTKVLEKNSSRQKNQNCESIQNECEERFQISFVCESVCVRASCVCVLASSVCVCMCVRLYTRELEYNLK